MSKWARFRTGDKVAFGQVEADQIAIYEGDMFANPAATGVTVALADVELMTPCEPSKMVAMVNNFHALLGKLEMETPEEPLYFFKANSSFWPVDKPIRRPKAYAGRIIFEGELGLVIGKECRDVSEAEALDYLFGVTCINDVTSFEILHRDPSFQQWTRCKAADTFGVMGPVITTGLNPDELVVKATLNGDSERQNYPISDMVFNTAKLISKISEDMTLLPGDVIACGTSVGVGALRDGNEIKIEIEGVGALVNIFQD